MSVADNKELVRYITEQGLNHGDTSFVDRVFAPDYVVHVRGLELPRGPKAFAGAVEFWRQSFPDFQVTIEQMVGEGEYVTHRFHTTGTHTGQMMHIAPTYKKFLVQGVDMHRVVDGLVVESWISDDMPRILMEIGALTPPQPDGGQVPASAHG